MHWAATNGVDTSVLAAVAGLNGADESVKLIDSKDDSAMTPLHHAASMNRVSAGRWLLEHGADKSLTDDSGRTPFDVAEQRSYLEFSEMLSKFSK